MRKAVSKELLLFWIFLGINTLFWIVGFRNNNCWYDETYTMAIIRHSFKDICSITANDVHPPLYYLLVKAITVVTGQHLWAVRIISYASYLGIMIISWFWISNRMDKRTALYFGALVSSIPFSLRYELECRMYNLAILFVFLV